MVWKMLFAEMTEGQTEKTYASEVLFPDVDGLLVGDGIRACWSEEFETTKGSGKSLKETAGLSRQCKSVSKLEPTGIY